MASSEQAAIGIEEDWMIRVRGDGEERHLSYSEFIREIQEGRIQADTPVLSDVLTSGVWKPAGELQFFRSWAPPGTVKAGPQESVARQAGAAEAAPAGTDRGWEPSEPEAEPEGDVPQVSHVPADGSSLRKGEGPWVPYGHRPGQGNEGAERDAAFGQGHRFYPADGGRYRRSHDEQSWEGGRGAGRRPVESGPLPWEEMDRTGFMGGLTQTISLALRDPEAFFRKVALGRGLMPALVFGLLMTAFSSLVVSVYELATVKFLGGYIEATLAEMPELFQGDLNEMMRWNLFGRGLALVLYPLIIFVFAGVAHFIVRLFGRPDAEFSATFRIVNYVSAIDILAAIPICGYLIAAIWSLVLLVKGLSRIHGVGTLSALIAVLLALPIVIFAPSVVLALFRAVAGIGSSV